MRWNRKVSLDAEILFKNPPSQIVPETPVLVVWLVWGCGVFVWFCFVCFLGFGFCGFGFFFLVVVFLGGGFGLGWRAFGSIFLSYRTV